MKKLSKRLLTLISFVPKGSFVADVGADHGALPIALINDGIAPFCQAIENKKGPFARLSKAVEEECLAPERLLLSLSDGLSSLDERVDTVVIAGMGGKLIARILLSHPEKLKHVRTLILDAHSEKGDALEAAASLSYKVREESFFYEENIPYSVWKMEKSEEAVRYSEEEKLFGPIEYHRKSAPWRRYIEEEIQRAETLLGASLPPIREKELTAYLNLLKEALS